MKRHSSVEGRASRASIWMRRPLILFVGSRRAAVGLITSEPRDSACAPAGIEATCSAETRANCS